VKSEKISMTFLVLCSAFSVRSPKDCVLHKDIKKGRVAAPLGMPYGIAPPKSR